VEYAEVADTNVPHGLVRAMAEKLAHLMDKYKCRVTHTMAELEHMCDVFRCFGADQLSKLDTFEQ